ncbi:MAG TPA: hypothetical protein VMF65_11015 [Acidimicrobiales bacterium]|nr:hypothetical protein [Acidimicrobiales bacterium]
MSILTVQSKFKPESVADVQAAVNNVIVALDAAPPEAIRYASLLLPDGETLVALLQLDDDVSGPACPAQLVCGRFALSGFIIGPGRYCCAPFGWADVAGVSGEEPMVTVEIAGTILALTINGLMYIFDDRGAPRLGPVVVGIDVRYEHGERLRAVTEFGWRLLTGARRIEHDPGLAQVHLRPAGITWRPVPVVFAEPENAGQPRRCCVDIAVSEVR